MIFDKQSMFSDAQAITASAASTNVIDLGASGTPYGGAAALVRDLGKSDAELNIQVVKDFATLTSLKVAVQTSDDEAFSSPAIVLESEAIPLATLKAGYRFPITRVPEGTNKRYVRLYYTVAGTNATAGTVTAGITLGNQSNR